MKIIGNLIWFIFGGLLLAIEYFIAASPAMQQEYRFSAALCIYVYLYVIVNVFHNL
jgi:uncharacterized membrane protein YccF (DUF307 family)